MRTMTARAAVISMRLLQAKEQVVLLHRLVVRVSSWERAATAAKMRIECGQPRPRQHAWRFRGDFCHLHLCLMTFGQAFLGVSVTKGLRASGMFVAAFISDSGGAFGLVRSSSRYWWVISRTISANYTRTQFLPSWLSLWCFDRNDSVELTAIRLVGRGTRASSV